LHPKSNKNNLKSSKEMEQLSKQEMERILGGGWVYFSDGTKYYIPDEEEGDDDDIIFE